MRRFIVLGLVGLSFVFASRAVAEPFQITDRVGFNPALDLAADAIASQVNNGFLAGINRTAFLESMGKAASSGTATLIADRASRPSVFVAAVGLQGGFQGNMSDLGAAGTNSLPPIGAGGQASLMIGIPATYFGSKSLDKLTFYLSGGALSLTRDSVSFKMSNFGLNASYQLVPEVGMAVLAKWGGLRLLSGLNYATGSVGYGGKITQTSGTMTVDMNIDLRSETSNFFIPLEISTSLQLFYLFNMYTGFAVDMNFGSAHFAGISSGPVTTGVGGATATAQLNLDDGTSGPTSKATTRFFIGGQMSLWALKVGAEYAILGNSTKALGLFAKIGI